MKEYKASNEKYIIRDPQTGQIIKQGEYRIKQPDTQQDFLNLEQDLIPRQVEEFDATYYTYAPSRNMKVKGVMRHSETI